MAAIEVSVDLGWGGRGQARKEKQKAESNGSYEPGEI